MRARGNLRACGNLRAPRVTGGAGGRTPCVEGSREFMQLKLAPGWRGACRAQGSDGAGR